MSHRSTCRPGSRLRVTSSSIPTSGERRKNSVNDPLRAESLRKCSASTTTTSSVPGSLSARKAPRDDRIGDKGSDDRRRANACCVHIATVQVAKAVEGEYGAVTLIQRFGSAGHIALARRRARPRSHSRSDERPASLEVLWLRRSLRWRGQLHSVVRPKLAPERVIITNPCPVDADREIVVDQ
jgi:hypothetical protein